MKIEDRNFGARPSLDPRNRDYPVFQAAQVGRLSRLWPCKTYLDQGSSYACSAFAVCHALIALGLSGITAKFALNPIYARAQQIDEWPGGDPAVRGTSVAACASVAKSLRMISSYQWAFGLDELISTISHLGPAVLTIPWRHEMSVPDEHGLMRVTGPIAGWHALLCVGIDKPAKRFRMHQSYGTAWGIGGDGYISFAGMAALLKAGGQVCVLRR